MTKHHEPKVKFDDNRTMLVAHRGLTSHHLENTLKALTTAFAVGADGVEFDVQLSHDMVPMVFHDRELMRLVGIDKNIDDMTYAELRGLLQRSDRYSENYPISTLEEVLSAMPADKLINVELKETTAMRGDVGMKEVIKVLARYKNRLKIVISSFDPNILAMVNAEDPEYSLGFLVDRENTLQAFLDSYPIVTHVDYIHPHIDLVNKETSRWIKDRGIKLIFWGHQALGEEDVFMADHHTALISDVTQDLIAKYRP